MILEPPTNEQLDFIKREEFYRPVDQLEEDVTMLAEWLSKQPHLPNVTDRKWLAHFISGCKYNLQRTKQVIESYFIARAEHPEFFKPYNRQMLVDGTKSGTVVLFPKLTSEGNRIICTKTNPMGDDDFEVMLFCQTALSLLDLQLKTEPVYGNIFLYDLEHVRLSHLMAFTPTITRNLFKCGLNSFPLRLKAVHYINAPKFTGRFITFFKMFLPNKLKERFFVHESLDDLYKHVSKDALPDIYGGTGGNMDKIEDDTLEFLMSNKEWLDTQPKADLSKRPAVQKTPDAMNMNGTFKRLQID